MLFFGYNYQFILGLGPTFHTVPVDAPTITPHTVWGVPGYVELRPEQQVTDLDQIAAIVSQWDQTIDADLKRIEELTVVPDMTRNDVILDLHQTIEKSRLLDDSAVWGSTPRPLHSMFNVPPDIFDHTAVRTIGGGFLWDVCPINTPLTNTQLDQLEGQETGIQWQPTEADTVPWRARLRHYVVIECADGYLLARRVTEVDQPLYQNGIIGPILTEIDAIHTKVSRAISMIPRLTAMLLAHRELIARSTATPIDVATTYVVRTPYSTRVFEVVRTTSQVDDPTTIDLEVCTIRLLGDTLSGSAIVVGNSGSGL